MGRFPTCSSPVRHVNARRRHVRLACIRHAASVNPEPGSNSPPKCLPASIEIERRTSILTTVSCVILDPPVSLGLRERKPKRPDASVLHLRPPSCPSAAHRGPRRFLLRRHGQPMCRQPTCQGACACRIQAKAHPSYEGRLIYHVSKTDVKGGLRGIRAEFSARFHTKRAPLGRPSRKSHSIAIHPPGCKEFQSSSAVGVELPVPTRIVFSEAP
jgi:hypothetical protein